MLRLFFLIFVFLLLLAIFAFFNAWRTRNKQPKAEFYAPPRDPFEEVLGAQDFSPNKLGPGAIITYGATDHVIRGALTMQQGPYVWYEYMLQSEEGARWLSVEIDEGQLDLIWWTTRRGAGMQPQTTMTFDNVTYHEQERGHARFTSLGTTGVADTGEVAYIDYEDSTGQQCLSFEDWAGGNNWEMSLGHKVLPGEFIVYPAPEH